MSITMPNGTDQSVSRDTFVTRSVALGFGGAAYLIFLATFLYAIAFVTNFAPKTVDVGPTSSLDDGTDDQPRADVAFRHPA